MRCESALKTAALGICGVLILAPMLWAQPVGGAGGSLARGGPATVLGGRRRGSQMRSGSTGGGGPRRPLV